MSLITYLESQEIATHDFTFYALVMAAMRKADDTNLARLQEAFPSLLEELRKRYNAPGGALNDIELDYVKAMVRENNPDDDPDE